MHIGDLDGSGSVKGKNQWTATVTILVHDVDENPVFNATVSGVWSGGVSGNASCKTNQSGQCSVSKNKINLNSSVTFTVTGANHATLSYQPEDNHDPDGDSDGVSITFSLPH